MGFNREKLDTALNIGVHDVNYQLKLPKIKATLNDLGKNEENLKIIMLTKLKHWEYEAEVRVGLLLNEMQSNIYKYEPDVLETIIFGCKTSNDDKKHSKNR